MHEQLAAIPAVQVSQIAATLLRDGGDEIEAIRKAYRLLDIAEHCNLSLDRTASVEAGLKNYQEGVKVDDDFYNGMANLPKWEWKHDEDGNRPPVPFDEGLAALIPRPGVPKSKTKDERLSRFKAYMMQYYRDESPEKGEQTLMIEVGERIARVRREGIPADFFGRATLFFPDWWERSVSERKSAAGKKGQAAKKAKAAPRQPTRQKKK